MAAWGGHVRLPDALRELAEQLVDGGARLLPRLVFVALSAEDLEVIASLGAHHLVQGNDVVELSIGSDTVPTIRAVVLLLVEDMLLLCFTEVPSDPPRQQ